MDVIVVAVAVTTAAQYRSRLHTVLQSLVSISVTQCRPVVRRGDRHSKSRPAPHCRVLPPGEFNAMISDPLPVCSESFTTIDATVFP